MKTIVADYETMWGDQYTLSKMDPPSYVLDPRFEVHCLGIAEDDNPAYIVDGPDVGRFWKQCDPNVAVVSHNCLFDACITSWIYNFVPKLLVDTLSISRTVQGHLLKSHSLKSIAKHFGLPEKGDVVMSKNMTRADIIACGLWPAFQAYCLNDVELCRAIFKRLITVMPDEELIIHDMITRCAVEPRFRLDTNILAEHLQAVRAEKEEIYAQAQQYGLESKADLMSNQRFAALLRNLGVDPPLKISPTTSKLTYAFSRQDVEFMELREHEDLRVQVMVEARLGHKTTLEETRTERMLNIANLEFPHHGGHGIMPIPLKLGAAITHRLGGDWKLNCQNWGRQSPIRRSVRAPDGYAVVASDASQIEARLTAWFSGQHDMVERFAQGIDEYANFASFVYGFPVDKVKHPGPRFVGKTGVLQLGYQSGWLKFQKTVLLLSTKDGTPIELSDEQAQRVVYGYREKYWAINQMWSTLGSMIPWMQSAAEGIEHVIGPITFAHEMMIGPNGLVIHYKDLTYDPAEREWRYTYGGRTYKIYGGKVLENIIQFLARIATMQAAVRVKRRTSNLTVHFAHQAHDELVYLSPIDQVDVLVPILNEEMSRTPEWAPGLPLRGETKVGPSYGDLRVYAAGS